MAKERTRLKFDLDALLPGETITIGETDVMIRPLGLRQYKTIVTKIKAFSEELSGRGVTMQNYKEPSSMIEIAETLVTKFPDILEEVSNISQEDLDELPIEVILGIIDKCIEVNMKSKESLLGNWNSLLGRMSPFLQDEQKKADSPK